MKRHLVGALAVFLVLILAIGSAAAEPAAEDAVVSFRVEGMEKNLYYNSAMPVSFSGTCTVRDVIKSLSGIADAPAITVINEKENSRVIQVGELKEKSIGSLFDDGWMISVNGRYAGKAPDVIEISPGDDIVLCYGDASLLQYPQIDLARMITDGIVKIYSENTAVDDMGNTYIIKSSVVDATVTWDGMRYTTDSNGEIIIDSTGAGVRHMIQIERYHDNGMPTVLRLAPGYFVKHGFNDVLQDAWYFDAVMFVSDKYLLTGVSDAAFGPAIVMNRGMLVTVLGRMSDVVVDQTEETGFTDVIYDSWSTGYISWAVKSGIVFGNSDGTFGQYKDVTREQLAVMLYRYTQFKGYDTTLANPDLSAYTDVAIMSDYAETAMRWAVEYGLMTGTDGRLNPLGSATRAEVATMLERFISAFKV